MPGIDRPWPRRARRWVERWSAPEDHLQTLETAVRRLGIVPIHGGVYDRWDLEVPGGLLASARILMTVEEHGAGRQMLRFRAWPRCHRGCLFVILLLSALTVLGGLNGAAAVACLLGVVVLTLGVRALIEAGAAMAALRVALSAAHPDAA
jgi:hypothetical protein